MCMCDMVNVCSSLAHLQHSFEDVLNLGALACEEVIIQFAAVNKHGLSSYSPSTSLFVYGG